MTDIDEAMLIAWVDGELDEVARRRVDRAAAADPALAQRLEMHRCLRNRLSAHYAPIESEPAPPAMRALLNESAKVAPIVRPAPPRWRDWRTAGAVAASLALGVGIGHLSSGIMDPIGMKGGVMVARGELASTLDAQLASAQENAAIRIGLSFQRKGGGWCRSFEGAALSGVACRQGEDWRMQQLVPGARQATDYRQASAGDPRIMATVEALMEGAPADAEQEAAAKAKGWR